MTVSDGGPRRFCDAYLEASTMTRSGERNGQESQRRAREEQEESKRRARGEQEESREEANYAKLHRNSSHDKATQSIAQT